MEARINTQEELSAIMQELPAELRNVIIEATGIPEGSYYPETLTDYVYRLQDELHERRHGSI